MPNVKVLINFEHCFNADGSINKPLFNFLAVRGLLDDITLVVNKFPMDGRLNSLKNYIRDNCDWKVFKAVLSVQDLYLINIDSQQYQLGYAKLTQQWADESYWGIEEDIKSCKIENILEKIFEHDCIKLLLEKGLFNPTTTLAELCQKLKDKEFSNHLIKQLLPNLENYHLAMENKARRNDLLKHMDPIIRFDCQTLLNLHEKLSKIADQNQTLATYQDKLLDDYRKFEQFRETKAALLLNTDAYLNRLYFYLYWFYAARNLFYISHLKENAKNGAKKYQLVDINSHYLAQLPANQHNTVLYIGNPEDLPKKTTPLLTIQAVQNSPTANITADLNTFINELFEANLTQLRNYQAQSPDASIQNDINKFIDVVRKDKQENPNTTSIFSELVNLLSQALQNTEPESITACQNFLMQNYWFNFNYISLTQNFFAVLIDLQMNKLREISKTKNGQLIKAEIDAVIKAIIKIQQSKPNKLNDLLTTANTVITAINDPTPQNFKSCQTLANQVQRQASPLWQGLGIALMALGAALIILGALVATSTIGLATIPGASLITAGVTATQAGLGTVVVGSAALLAGSLFTFFGQKSGLAKSLDHLSVALEEANRAPKPANDSATAPLLQKS